MTRKMVIVGLATSMVISASPVLAAARPKPSPVSSEPRSTTPPPPPVYVPVSPR